MNDKISGGYYLKAKCIQKSWIAHASPCTREIWDWLLCQANFEDRKDNGHTILRGQLFRTYDDIREGLSWNIGFRKCRYSKDQTKKSMKALLKHQMIALMKAPRGVLITVCNYDTYQNIKNYESTTKAPIKHQCDTSINKELKELKENKEYICVLFEKFWNEYPRKINKEIAKKAFIKIEPDDELTDMIIYALKEQIKDGSIDLKENLKFCPHASTWLNQKRYMDSLEEVNE